MKYNAWVLIRTTLDVVKRAVLMFSEFGSKPSVFLRHICKTAG